MSLRNGHVESPVSSIALFYKQNQGKTIKERKFILTISRKYLLKILKLHRKHLFSV